MDCKEIMKKALTIKEITINQIDLVLSQKKRYYRNDEFPFTKQKNGKLHVTSFRDSTPRTFWQKIVDFFCNIFN